MEASDQKRPTVIVVGLGPGGLEFLTRAATDAIERAETVLLRTARHPGTEIFTGSNVRALDSHYEKAPSFEDAYDAIVTDVVAEAVRLGEVTYVVPGSPLILESTVERLRALSSVEVKLVPSLSFLDLAWERLGIDPVTEGVRLVDGQSFEAVVGEASGALLVAQTYSKEILSAIKLAIDDDDVRVTVLHHLGLGDEIVTDVALVDLDRSVEPDHLTSLYIPKLSATVGRETSELVEVVRLLREQCPWDMAQTHLSLVRHFVEETYEAIEAIEMLGDPPDLERSVALEEELGDVLCQVLFHSAIATQEGLFSFADVARTLRTKLVRRHPHVFAVDGELAEPDDVLESWEQAKRVEKGRTSVLDGIPTALPALLLAQKIARRERELLGSDVSASGEGELRELFDALLSGDVEATGVLLFEVASRSGFDVEEALRQQVGRVRDRIVEFEGENRPL